MARQAPPAHLKVVAAAAATSSNSAANHFHASVGNHLKIPSVPIPGLKTSAAFLTSLSANLRISDSPDLLPSPGSTPPSMRGSTEFVLPPPSPLAVATNADSMSDVPSAEPTPSTLTKTPTLDLPSLTTFPATSEEEKTTALKLIADSVAQQRQTASRALIWHPLNMALYTLFVLIPAMHYTYNHRNGPAAVILTVVGVTMSILVAVRWATSGYIQQAEHINWGFLDDSDTVLITKWGDNIVGALVLSWAVHEGGARGRKRRGRGVIRAWTVLLKYRKQGLGTALLERAVEIVGKKGGEGIEFAADHANSHRILPHFYNGVFARRELRAHDALQDVIDTHGSFNRKRRFS